jgi:hypothetical protein
MKSDIGKVGTQHLSPSIIPQQTIADIIAQMDQVIARCYREQSKLGYFAVLYRNVTVRVRDGIAAGRFENAARMERLDVIFAQRYLDALDQFWRGETPTQSWVVAFRAAREWSPIILQHLLFGMNAHINLDLAIAAAQAAPGNELPGLKRDFEEITVLLNEMIQGMQDRIEQVSPWFRVLDRVGGRTNEQLCGFGIEQARNLAWLTANLFAATAPEKMADQIALHDQIVAGLGNLIRSPIGNLLRGSLALIRLREAGDVRAVMNVLRM